MSLRIEKRSTESTTDLQKENTDEEDAEATKKTIPFKEKIRTWGKLITVEPALFVYLFASSLAIAAIENLQFEMTCRGSLGWNDTLCSDYASGIIHTSGKLIHVKAWSQMVVAVLSGILVLCFSTFSDRYKIRKPFFVLPIFGEVLSCIGLLLCVIFINDWPIEVYFVFATILPACFGGIQTIIMAINSYIADISTIEERTTRVGFVEFFSLILTPIAPALGGILYAYIGYYGILIICGILFLFATLYAWFYIPEKRGEIVRTKNTCIDVFNIKTVVINMVKILVRKRIGYRRCLLLLTYICYIMITGPNAEILLMNTYASQKFNLDASAYQYFKSFDILTHILGMLLAITIFVRKLKVPDLLMVVIACCFKIITPLWYAFSKSLIMFYIGPIISMFNGIFIIALRSLVTKLVSQSEVAKAQALFAICEMIQPLIYNLIYKHVFEATKTQFIEAFLFLSAGLYIPPLILSIFMNALYKKGSKKETEASNKETNEINGHQKQGVYNESNDIETSRL